MKRTEYNHKDFNNKSKGLFQFFVKRLDIPGLSKLLTIQALLAFIVSFTACKDETVPNIDANLLEIELEGQIGVSDADVANSKFACTIYGDDYSNVKIKRMIISENAISSVKVGESLSFSNETSSAEITITSETGVKKTYTIKAEKFVVPEFTGDWTLTNECFFNYTYCNEDGTDCGQDYYGSLSSNDYGSYFIHGDQIYDNTLKMEFASVDGSGNLTGTFHYGPGADGKIGSFEHQPDGGEIIDLNENFTRLFPGDGTWKMNPVSNEITFYNSDKSKQSTTYSNSGDKVHWQVETLDGGAIQFTLWLKVNRTGLPTDHEALLEYGYNATAWTLAGYMIGFKMIKDTK